METETFAAPDDGVGGVAPGPEEEAEEAKAICNICPVCETCLEYALANREREGVWGGLNERERRRVSRQRRKSA